MPVTEIALLRLDNEDLSTSTKTGLLGAQQAQTEYSNHQVYFLRQIEDPACVYLLGGWESIEKHRNEWIPSETNQRLLQQLTGNLEVKWMFHVDVNVSKSLLCPELDYQHSYVLDIYPCQIVQADILSHRHPGSRLSLQS
jgi:hypothetical protein